MTLDYYENQKSKASGTKTVQCKFHNDDDCSKETIVVKKSAAKYYLCDKCKAAGKILDKRSSKEAYEKRAKGFEEKWGKGVRNPRHIPGVIEKTKITNEEKYGGTGFASKELAEKTRNTIKEKFDEDNIMKSEKGKQLYFDSMENKYGIGVKSPTQIKLVAEKISKKLKGRSSPNKGKTYFEIYEPDKAQQLIEDKRQIGAESYKIKPTPSQFQIELFELVKTIFNGVRLEFLIIGENDIFGKYGYVLDIAIPEYNLCIEYDSSYYHGKEEMTNHDNIRDDVLKNEGWDTIRFRDKIPSINELKIEIMKARPELFKFNG